MARTPITFESLGAQFRPIGRDPTAGTKNQANAEIFAQIRRLASGVGTAEAERIAPELAQAKIDEAKTAAVENNEPIKMPEKRLGIIPGAQQYNSQIELGYKAEVAMSFDSNINALAEPYLNDSSRNPAEFQKVADGFFEGFSKSIDPVIAPSILPQAQGKISSLFTSLNNKYLAQELKNANAAIENTQAMLERNMIDAIVAGDNAKATTVYGQLVDNINAYSAANPNFDKATALQGLGATKKDAEITAEANRIFNEQGSGAALQYIEQFRINKPAEWTQGQTITNLAQLQTDINRRESINKSSTAAQNSVIKNDVNTLLKMAINGDKILAEDINELETSIATMPELEQGPALEVLQNVRSIQQYTSLDAKARQAMLEATNTSETYPLYLNLATAEKGLQDAFKHNGIKQLVDMGVVSPEDMNEHTGFITTLFEDISAAEDSGDIQATFDKFSASYKQLQEYAYQASDIAGNPVSMFLPNQVDTLVGQLESFTKLENEGQNVFPIAQKLALVAALSVDPQNGIFANLAEKGQGSMAVAGQIIANTNNFGLAQTILQGQNQINTNPELYNINKPLISQATETWNEMTAGIYDNQPPFVTKAVRDAVMAYYVTLDDAKVTSTDNAIDKRLYKESIDAVTGGISKLNNHNYILPLDFRRGINGNDVEAYLFQVMDSDTFWNMEKSEKAQFIPTPTGGFQKEAEFVGARLNNKRPFADNGIPLISKAEWDNVGLVSVGTNRYKLIRAGQSGSVNNPAQIIKTTNADGEISDYIITITPDMIYTFKEQERIKQSTSDAKLSALISRELIESAEAGSPFKLNLIDNMQLKRQNDEEWNKAQFKILKEMDE
tara:strand:- start:255 stop:2786 length:2532 start_codon:yes stop_codon:yes gene_type:complete